MSCSMGTSTATTAYMSTFETKPLQQVAAVDIAMVITSDMLAKPKVFDCETAGTLLNRMAATMALTALSLLGVYRKVRQSTPCCSSPQPLGHCDVKDGTCWN